MKKLTRITDKQRLDYLDSLSPVAIEGKMVCDSEGSMHKWQTRAVSDEPGYKCRTIRNAIDSQMENSNFSNGFYDTERENRCGFDEVIHYHVFVYNEGHPYEYFRQATIAIFESEEAAEKYIEQESSNQHPLGQLALSIYPDRIKVWHNAEALIKIENENRRLKLIEGMSEEDRKILGV